MNKKSTILISLFILISLLILEKAFSQEDIFERAEKYVNEKRSSKYFQTPKRKKDTELIMNFIIPAIIKTSEKYNIDPKLSIIVSYKESSWNPFAIGKDKEIGLFQLKPSWFRKRKVKDINILNQIDIGIWVLKRSIEACGGHILKGLGLYQSGKTCKPTKGAGRKYKEYLKWR